MFIIIFIDHSAIINIAKQTSLIIFLINKLNLRLVRASNYIQRYSIDIRHILNKSNIVSNALSRLAIVPD